MADDALPENPFGTCPLPQTCCLNVMLGHGSGGLMTADLLQRIFLPGFDNDVLGALAVIAALQDGLAWPAAAGSRIDGGRARENL